MRRFLELLLAAGLGIGIVVVYLTWVRPPEVRACTRLHALCVGGDAPAPQQLAACVDGLRELKKIGGEQALAAPLQCIATADSCGEAGGCLIGTAQATGVGLLQGALQGLQKSLQGK